MSTIACASCGKLYDNGAFGAGRKYCNPICRDSKGYRYEINRTVGRPRRFPKVESAAEIFLINDFFRSRGWRLDQTHKEGVVRLVNGWFVVRLCYGGGQAKERAADACAFVEHKEVVFKSTCIKARRVIDGPKPRVQLGPCKQAKCKKCLRTRWLRERVRLAKPTYSTHTSITTPPQDAV